MKIYKVTYRNIYLESGENETITTVFLDKTLALKFYQREKEKIKKQEEELDMEDYCIDETDSLYERYLDGRSAEDSIAVFIEEDETYDERMLQELQKSQNEKDKDYEM